MRSINHERSNGYQCCNDGGDNPFCYQEQKIECSGLVSCEQLRMKGRRSPGNMGRIFLKLVAGRLRSGTVGTNSCHLTLFRSAFLVL